MAAAVSFHLTAPGVVGSSGSLDHRPQQASRLCAVGGRSFASVSAVCSRSRAQVCSSSSRRWNERRSGSFVVCAAAVDAAVATEEAEADAAVESLSMHFKAEGSLNDAAIPKVTKVLEGTEGVSNVKVYISEGAATVELIKQTNIQATGVASSLVEIIEQEGFKMQALSLGFDEDDDEDDEFIDYDPSTYVEEEEAEAA